MRESAPSCWWRKSQLEWHVLIDLCANSCQLPGHTAAISESARKSESRTPQCRVFVFFPLSVRPCKTKAFFPFNWSSNWEPGPWGYYPRSLTGFHPSFSWKSQETLPCWGSWVCSEGVAGGLWSMVQFVRDLTTQRLFEWPGHNLGITLEKEDSSNGKKEPLTAGFCVWKILSTDSVKDAKLAIPIKWGLLVFP